MGAFNFQEEGGTFQARGVVITREKEAKSTRSLEPVVTCPPTARLLDNRQPLQPPLVQIHSQVSRH